MEKLELDAFIPYQMMVVASRMSRQFSTLYRQKFGISVPEWRVVAHLSQSGTVSVREIQKRVDMEKSKVSRAATRLQNLGYVAKSANPTDGRLVALTLTKKGKEMMAELIPLADEFNAKIKSELQNDFAPFSKALDRLFGDTSSN